MLMQLHTHICFPHNQQKGEFPALVVWNWQHKLTLLYNQLVKFLLF